MIVVDASAAIRWFKPEMVGGAPAGLPLTDQPLVAPDLFVAEVRSAMLVYLRKREATREEALAVVATIERLMSDYYPIAPYREAAWRMALQFDHSPYDCFYLELARRLGTYLVTADRRLVRKFAGTDHERLLVFQPEWRP